MLTSEQLQAAADLERHRFRAERLGWSAAQATAMQLAADGDLHRDGRGYYATGRTGGRGRAIARARIRTLIAARLLGEDLTLTNDGRLALTAWDAADVEPAAVELNELPPVLGGQEATRRYKEWHARTATQGAEAHTRLEAALARAEAEHEAELARRAQREQPRYASVHDAINAAEDWTGYADNIGDVETVTGIDLVDVDDLAVEQPVEALELVAQAAPLATRPVVPTRPRTLARRPAPHAPALRRPARFRPAAGRPAVHQGHRTRRPTASLTSASPVDQVGPPRVAVGPVRAQGRTDR